MSKKDKKLDTILEQEVADLLLEKKILMHESGSCPPGFTRKGLFGCVKDSNSRIPAKPKKAKQPDKPKQAAAAKTTGVTQGSPKGRSNTPGVSVSQENLPQNQNKSATSPVVQPEPEPKAVAAVKKPAPVPKGSDLSKFKTLLKEEVRLGLNWDDRTLRFLNDLSLENYASDILYETTCFKSHPILAFGGLLMGSTTGTFYRGNIFRALGKVSVSAIQPVAWMGGQAIKQTKKIKNLPTRIAVGSLGVTLGAIGVYYADKGLTQLADSLPKDEKEKQKLISDLQASRKQKFDSVMGAMTEQQLAIAMGEAIDRINIKAQNELEPEPVEIQQRKDDSTTSYIKQVVDIMQQQSKHKGSQKLQRLSNAIANGTVAEIQALDAEFLKLTTEAAQKRANIEDTIEENLDYLITKYLPTKQDFLKGRDSVTSLPSAIGMEMLSGTGCFFAFGLASLVTSRFLRATADPRLLRSINLQTDITSDFGRWLGNMLARGRTQFTSLGSTVSELNKVYIVNSLLKLFGESGGIGVSVAGQEVIDLTLIQQVTDAGKYQVNIAATFADGSTRVLARDAGGDVVVSFSRRIFQGEGTNPALASDAMQKKIKKLFPDLDTNFGDEMFSVSLIEGEKVAIDAVKMEKSMDTALQTDLKRLGEFGFRQGKISGNLRAIAHWMNEGAEMSAQGHKFTFYRNTTRTLSNLLDESSTFSLPQLFSNYRKLYADLIEQRKLEFFKGSTGREVYEDVIYILRTEDGAIAQARADGVSPLETIKNKLKENLRTKNRDYISVLDAANSPAVRDIEEVINILSEIQLIERRLYGQSLLIEEAFNADRKLAKLQGSKTKVKLKDYFKTPAGESDRAKLEALREQVSKINSYLFENGIFLKNLAVQKGSQAFENFGFQMSKLAAGTLGALTLGGARKTSLKNLGKNLDHFDAMIGRPGQTAPSKLQKYFEDLQTSGDLEKLFTGSRVKKETGELVENVKGFNFYNLFMEPIARTAPGFQLARRGQGQRTTQQRMRMELNGKGRAFYRLTAEDGNLAGFNQLFGLTGSPGTQFRAQTVTLKGGGNVRVYIQRKIGNEQDPAYIAKVFRDAYYMGGLREQLREVLQTPVRETNYLSKNGATIMEKKDLKRLVSEILNENSGQGYAKYPYNSNEYNDEEPRDDYIEEWKSFSIELIRDETRNTAIEVAKILVKDLELFEDVLDLAGQNQSVGTEILAKLKQAREEA
tara:strand:+ start:1536 stop:5189 length:3654 start_codon:yes stop_codon:yes gene_type:complete